MRVLIKGAGDLASGIAIRLRNCGFEIIMTDLERPTAIRRTVAFSEAILKGWARVEGHMAIHAHDAAEALGVLDQSCIPVIDDPQCRCLLELKPDILIDAIIAKKNLETTIKDAPLVIAIGPGFTAGKDCHAVVESMRGHTLGRVYYEGSALPNTAIPGLIGGYAGERVLRAPCDGVFTPLVNIGDMVSSGDKVAYVADDKGDHLPVNSTIDGVLRGILPEGTPVFKGMKSGDVDPRAVKEHCYTASDKALAIAGGVLEGILHFLHNAP